MKEEEMFPELTREGRMSEFARRLADARANEVPKETKPICDKCHDVGFCEYCERGMALPHDTLERRKLA